jgi:hypothetical protein
MPLAYLANVLPEKAGFILWMIVRMMDLAGGHTIAGTTPERGSIGFGGLFSSDSILHGVAKKKGQPV